METLLLNKADFADYADLPESLDMDRMRPHILTAQRQRLRPVLTDRLADELLRLVAAERAADVASPAPLVFPWSTLRTKSVAVVACAAMARYMPFAQQIATASGFRLKGSEHSQPADGRDLARQATIYDGDALTNEVALAKWLKANGAEFGSYYPQASTCCGAAPAGRTPSVVVQGIAASMTVPIACPSGANPFPMKNIDFLLKMASQLSEAEQMEFYLLQRDKLIYRIPYPLPGQRPSATPGRYAYATPKP